MEVKLSPDLQAFVDERVKLGEYLSADELVATAIEQLREEVQGELSEEDSRAIEEAEAAFAAGDYVDFDSFAEAMKKKDAP